MAELHLYYNITRFNDEDWNALIKDEIFCPLITTNIAPEKIMIVAGKHDDEINSDDLKHFAELKGINNFVLEDAGHISPSKISGSLFNKIFNFFEIKYTAFK